MAGSEDLIDFDVIEGQKENIQSLPGGRSAKKLAQLFSPTPLHKLSTPTPSDTKSINDLARAEFEAEVAALSESDDPLDIYDRYVRWTFDAYPSAQATPQSQLHTLLERATKAFIGSSQYKNDPRYLKLWLQYIRFFSDAPRETFVFLSRHSIGEGLALFYEEYAAWLEGAGRWNQAEQVYKLGIEREARPVARLLRKFGEFDQRRAQQPEAGDAPSSPALPTVRPALVAKVDPFAAAARTADPQAPRSTAGVGGVSSKPAKSKLAIFSDADAAPPAIAPTGAGSKGWDTIESLEDRKKENMVEPKPWAGETLKAGGKKSSAPKMSIFRDPALARIAESHIVIAPSKHQVIVNPVSGRKERVFVNLEAVYPTPEEPGTELSFEEIWAATRGWLNACWDDEGELEQPSKPNTENSPDVAKLSQKLGTSLVIHRDQVLLDENGAVVNQPKASKPKKKKLMEVNETQIIKAKLDSPSGRKIRKKHSAEPTMTIHTRAATDEIYDIFNAPLQSEQDQDEQSDEDEYMTDGDYTSGGESTCTTRQISMSDAGDDETSDVKSVSEWSDFTARKHIPSIDDEGNNDDEDEEERQDTQVSDLLDISDREVSGQISGKLGSQDGDHEVLTPIEEDFSPRTRTVFVPIPPEDYVHNARPFRDPVEVANNRLPFMTPITERTESSLGLITAAKQKYAYATTPSSARSLREIDEDEDEEEDDEDFEPLSSPLREILKDDHSPVDIAPPMLKETLTASIAPATVIPKGPIIKDLQCNPVQPEVQDDILLNMYPPLSSYAGFYDNRDTRCNRGVEIRKFANTLAKNRKNGSSERTSMGAGLVTIGFPEIEHTYTLKREIGVGAYGPVYLVENSGAETEQLGDDGARLEADQSPSVVSRRTPFEALKMEKKPSAWEFYMMRLAAKRLGPGDRATASISIAHELHLYQDESFLFLPYHPHGSLLDVVNFFREQSSGAMDEPLAMFFTIEGLRTVEALHAKQILHGDLKADNCLLRLDDLSSEEGAGLSAQWRRDGSGGWASRGVVLIDFGRGIDVRAFAPEVQFIADWKTNGQDCAEMREGRPWTWQIDYHGLAGIVHCLLFGRYIDTVRCDATSAAGGAGVGGPLLPLATVAGAGRRYKIRENLKRYWQTDLWSDCFDLLLNPAASAGAEDGGRMPVTRGLRAVRERMEDWLEANCEKGVGLRQMIQRVEGFVGARNRK